MEVTHYRHQHAIKLYRRCVMRFSWTFSYRIWPIPMIWQHVLKTIGDNHDVSSSWVGHLSNPGFFSFILPWKEFWSLLQGPWLPKQLKYCCKVMALPTFGRLLLQSASQTWRGGFSGFGRIGGNQGQGANAGPTSRTGESLERWGSRQPAKVCRRGRGRWPSECFEV